jgi:hypothetical protein
MIKSLKRYTVLLPMSDVKKEVEAVKKNEGKGKYEFALTKDIEAVDKYVRIKISEYAYVSIFVHVSWHISNIVPSWDVKDVAVLPTDAYRHVPTLNLNYDPTYSRFHRLLTTSSKPLYLDKHIHIDMSQLQGQEVHHIASSKWRHIGKVKDGHHPTPCADAHSLT